ncbi:MAG: transporter substrate-binding domain-containing protein [Sedimentibacter sp.]
MKKLTKMLAIMMALCTMVGMVSGCAAKDTTETAKTKNRLEDIQSRGYIEVVTEPYFAPFEFIDPSKKGDEQYVGSDIKLAQYIADELGVELHIIPLEFSAVLSSITEKKYDLAISALSFTPARAEAMNMSKGYYFAEGGEGHGLLIRKEDAANIKGPDDISDKVIVAQSGSLQELFVNEQIPKSKEFKRVSAVTDGFLMVQEGKADVCATYIPTGQLYIDANTNSGLPIVEGFKFTQDESTAGNRIGIPLGEDELTAKINEIIDKLVSSGDFEQWHEEYTKYAKDLGL